MTDVLPITPLDAPPDSIVPVPGSKSMSNRALLIAGLAHGTSRIEGVLRCDDTEAMLGCLTQMGVTHEGELGDRIDIVGVGGTIGPAPISVDVRQSGVTARFITPALALSSGPSHVDGDEQIRRRPMSDVIAALEGLGALIDPAERLPIDLRGGGIEGGAIVMPGSTSSQFLSGLLVSSPYFAQGIDVTMADSLISRPYVDMTIAAMAEFGVDVARDDYSRFVVPPGGYQATTFVIEPDASSASYFFALAAMTRGRILVEGLGSNSIQGDVKFVDVLEAMGAVVRQGAYWTEVVGRGLTGIDVDMADISDTVPTFAAVAACAETPSRVRNVGFIRGKESDRISAMVTELNRIGIRATEHSDGFTVFPGQATGGVVETYDDHRIAMAFGILGLRHPGITIANPGCVAKTFPTFWETVEAIRSDASDASDPDTAVAAEGT